MAGGMSVGIVLGGAACVWHDLDALGTMTDISAVTVIATNEAGVHYDGELHHWCTLHSEKMHDWESERAALGKPKTYTTWGRVYPFGHEALQKICDRAVKHDKGTSGMLAVEVAVQLGLQRIVLCGVPMNGDPHFFGDEGWTHFEGFRKHWQRRKRWLERHHVRSMSGWTAELLGQPTVGWLTS
jgi:hypothetical protein